MVTHIFSFLGVSDRKEASLVCRTWYDASLDPILLRDIVVTFNTPATVTTNTISSLGRRKTPNLVLDNIDGSYHSKALVLESCKHMCRNLHSLSLKGSDITESNLITILSHCNNLESLDLSCCNSLFMSGQLLSKDEDVQKLQSSLKNVRNLNLSSIRYLSDSTFNRITGVCPNIRSLSLAGCQITFHSDMYYSGHSKHANSALLTQTNIMVFICKHSESLKSLDFSRTTISGDALGDLACSYGLELDAVELAACRDLSDDGISILCRKQPGLKSLNVAQCVDLTDQSLSAICANLSQLRNLNISKCRQITDRSIVRLKMLMNLTSLDATACYGITSSGIMKGLCASEWSNMSHLILNSCSSVLDDFVRKFCMVAGHNTKHLDLRSCRPITDLSLHFISRYMKNLQVLRLAWCKEITDCGLLGISNPELGEEDDHVHKDGLCKCSRKEPSTDLFKKICEIMPREDRGAPMLTEKFVIKCLEDFDVYPISNMSKLRVLDLSNLPKITDVGIKQAVRFNELKSLYMIMCQSLTDESLIAVANHVPSLEELHVSQCHRITDIGLKYIAQKLPRLSSLEIAMCDHISDHSIDCLAMNAARLQHIDVSLCSGVTLEAVDMLEHTLPNLHSVHKRLVGSGSS